jgi:hypothetical protein
MKRTLVTALVAVAAVGHCYPGGRRPRSVGN